MGGFTPEAGDSWRIIEGFTTEGNLGLGTAYAVSELVYQLPPNFHLTVHDEGNGSGYAMLTYAPEPATLGILAFGALGILRRRKRMPRS